MARANYSKDLVNLRKTVINTLDSNLMEYKQWTSFDENLAAFLRVTLNPPKVEVERKVNLSKPSEPEPAEVPPPAPLNPPNAHEIETEKSKAAEPPQEPLLPPSTEEVETVYREIKATAVLVPEVPSHPPVDDLNSSNEHDELNERGAQIAFKLAELPEVARSPPPGLKLTNKEVEASDIDRYVTIKSEALEESMDMEWYQFMGENDGIDDIVNPGPPPETPILPEDQHYHAEFDSDGRKSDQTPASAARPSEDISSSAGSWLLEGIYFGQEAPEKAKVKKRKRQSTYTLNIENKRPYNPKRTVTALRKYLLNCRGKIRSISKEGICVKLKFKKWDKIVEDGWKFFNRLMYLRDPEDQTLDNDIDSVKNKFEEEFPDVECYINACKEEEKHAVNHYEVNTHRKYCCSVCAETESLQSSLDISELLDL